jgi:hypothetical protein
MTLAHPESAESAAPFDSSVVRCAFAAQVGTTVAVPSSWSGWEEATASVAAHAPVVRIVPFSSPPRWLVTVAGRLADISRLTLDWDGYGAVAPTSQTIVSALDAVATFMPDFAAAPNTVPTAEGGVQFEWHGGGWDVEVEILPSGESCVYGARRDGDEMFDGDIGAVREDLVLAIKSISQSLL